MVINIKCTRAPGMYPFLKDGRDDGVGGGYCERILEECEEVRGARRSET